MREAQGDTMESFARKLRVSLNTVSRWENSLPPRGKSLEKLYRYAKRHGPETSAATLLRSITDEKSQEYRRYRTQQILDAGNVQDLRVLFRELWELEATAGRLDPLHDSAKREYFLLMADHLFVGGRKEFLGYYE
jgi:transcriptional regulator with XRE-family HTH domain